MNYQTFSPLYVSNLTVAGIFSLNKSTIELAKPIINELGPIATAAIAQVELANQALGQSMNQNQKSGHSQEVKLLDKECDTYIAEIFRMTASYLKSSDPVKKAAASTMQLFISPYKGIAQQPVNVEIASVANLVQKYKALPEVTAAAQVLDLDTVFLTLGLKNTALNTIYQTRNTEYAERDISASSLKPVAVTAYIQFCTAIEQALNYTPNDTLVAVFNKMDEHRKKFHALEGTEKPELVAADTQVK